MKTRSRNMFSDGEYEIKWRPMGIWPTPPNPISSDTLLVPAMEELFEAYTGPNPTVGQTWTNFHHYKRWIGRPWEARYMLPWVSAWPNTGGRYWLGEFPIHFGWAHHGGLGSVLPSLDLFQPDAEGGFVPPPEDLDTLKQRGLNAVMPGIKAELSLVNSVIELKDFKGLAKKAWGTLLNQSKLLRHLPAEYWGNATLGHLKLGWRNYLRDLKSSIRRDGLPLTVAKRASENFLQWKFAIAPLISDVQAVRRALRTLEKRLNDLITNEGRVRTRHWGYKYEEYAPSNVRYTPYILAVPNAHPVMAVNKVKTESSAVNSEFHVEVRYNYNFSDYQREHARILGLLDSLGISSNPAIIWNAIPYTFLIDWVLNVSKYLDQFNVANMDPKVNILGSLWSIKRSRVTWWSKIHTYEEGMNGTRELSMPAVNETAYRRQLFMPGISSLTMSGLSASELTLGAALVIARARRKSRK